VEVTDANFTGFQGLSEGFRFDEFIWQLSQVPRFAELKHSEARLRMAALEEKTEHHDGAIAVLQDRSTQVAADFAHLQTPSGNSSLPQ
jgi:hypothetical protein